MTTSAQWIKPTFESKFEYYMEATDLSDWYTSRAWCMSQGGDLASIHSKMEGDWINNEVT